MGSYLSGFCGLTNPPDSHARCRGAYQDRACRCECHRPARTMVADHAELVDVTYRSPEWYAARRESVAASEIASVVGLSPWVSRFDLWWLKRTADDSQAENKGMRRGRRYERLILEDFADEHPEFYVGESVTVRSIDRPWQVSTPDGLVYEQPNAEQFAGHPVAVVEAKTGQRHEWGETGTDQIPVHYRCQVLWQMDTLGLSVAYLPVLFGDQYAEYVVEYDESDVLILRAAAEEFLASVCADRVPEVDSHTATTRRLKRLHPDLTDEQVEVPVTWVRQYQRAKALRDAAQDRMRLAENRIRDRIKSAATGVIDLGDGKTKTFSHSIYDVKPRTQEIAGHTVNRINLPRKAV